MTLNRITEAGYKKQETGNKKLSIWVCKQELWVCRTWVNQLYLMQLAIAQKRRRAIIVFVHIEPNIGLVDVPDQRLSKLAALVHPNRIVPTQIEIVDIAGLVRGASKGEGLGNKFLANIREVDAIIHVVRCFEDENILREEGPINPVGDKDVIDTELQLKDLESVEKKIQRTEKWQKPVMRNKEQSWRSLRSVTNI
jgi:ribosome-binding ATPase YchF (GTP1/OBG family)